MLKEVTGKPIKIARLEEREREGRRKVVIVELDNEEDRERVLERRTELWGRWRIQIDKDLTMEERRTRWRLVERARKERREGKKVVVTNRKLWIKGVEWRWMEKEERWKAMKGE